MVIFVDDRVKNIVEKSMDCVVESKDIVGKEENAGNQNFLHLPPSFFLTLH